MNGPTKHGLEHTVMAPLEAAGPPSTAAQAEGEDGPDAAPGGHDRAQHYEDEPRDPLAPAATAAAESQHKHHAHDHTDGAG